MDFACWTDLHPEQQSDPERPENPTLIPVSLMPYVRRQVDSLGERSEQQWARRAMQDTICRLEACRRRRGCPSPIARCPMLPCLSPNGIDLKCAQRMREELEYLNKLHG
jgi:hypothetical protein